MSIYFDVDDDVMVPDNYEGIVKDIIDASLDFLECPYECEVNVLFTDDDGIHEINREQRDIDAPTDVLSFPMLEFDTEGDFSHINEEEDFNFNPDSGELMLGDIVLNVDRIAKQAQEYGHTRRRELAFLTAHSMLHLSGYDHIDDAERIVMEQKQEQILNSKGYTRDNEDE